jgi:predicted membrane-bound dolichyl-phosphate-mannose-protein mannosyltransferase
MVWIVGLIPLAAVVGLAVWVYDPAYRRAWRTGQRPELPQARPALPERAVSEPPAS